VSRGAVRKWGGLLPGRVPPAVAVAVAVLLSLLALLAGGCGRKARPEPLFDTKPGTSSTTLPTTR
jgi:hypothetical protein